jgi:hypothetical protein
MTLIAVRDRSYGVRFFAVGDRSYGVGFFAVGDRSYRGNFTVWKNPACAFP